MTRIGLSYAEVSRTIRVSLARNAPRRLEPGTLKRAAVLVPILRRGEDARIPFTLRSDTLDRHRGEISFPGGRCEPGEDAPHAALREAFEEIALDPHRVDVIGWLDDFVSVSGYVVTPVVGFCDDPPERCVARASEVSEVFEVSLADLSDPSRRRSEWWDLSRLPADAPLEDLRRAAIDPGDFDRATGRYRMYFFDAGPNRVIWGLTARILEAFLGPIDSDPLGEKAERLLRLAKHALRTLGRRHLGSHEPRDLPENKNTADRLEGKSGSYRTPPSADSNVPRT